jgi:two-component system NtrC family sensor kinase
MSLKKKVVLGFLLSAGIIAFLSGFLYLNYVEIHKETEFLELTDTIRSKSLQLRRHEKNYFLYAPAEAASETEAIHQYLTELDEILRGAQIRLLNRTASLHRLVQEYRSQFTKIEALVGAALYESGVMKRSSPAYRKVSNLVEANFLNKPLEDANYLQAVGSVPQGNRFIMLLKDLEGEITSLRKTGENILAEAKELDTTARGKVDNFNHQSRNAILIIFPLFLVVGFGTFFLIINSVVKRLQLLTDVVEKAGEGRFTPMPLSRARDEVGTLIQKFNIMEEHLTRHEKELIQSKKLAAIGTLAAGVAHELNNPLNNIYTTAQRLQKKTGEEYPDFLKKGLDDIFGQTMRVKRIVGDLLAFARGREPHLRPVELRSLLAGVYRHLGEQMNPGAIRFLPDLHPEEIVLYADQEQLEQVFINLFANAVDALSKGGDLVVRAEEEDHQIKIQVSDTGTGMPPETIEKVFEPFYSTKNKGTGLGLAIVFNIIQKHQGKIEVASAEGAGTTFTIILPKDERRKDTNLNRV